LHVSKNNWTNRFIKIVLPLIAFILYCT
jgi:hypothetical protein